VYDIEYSIEEDDYETPEEYNQVINSLPDTLVLDILVETDEDLEERVADEITHETNWLVKNFNYMIIEKK
jgi:predicted nucleotidyltransferase